MIENCGQILCSAKNVIKSKEFEDYMNKTKRRITRGTSKIEQSFSLRDVQNPLAFSFTDMSLTTKTSPRKKILNNLFGVVYPFNVTAIVGTSGCGKLFANQYNACANVVISRKTTFLNLLRGLEGKLAIKMSRAHFTSTAFLYRICPHFAPLWGLFRKMMYLELTIEECITM